jgi:hypothetical protein
VGDCPFEDEGLKRSQSGSSSPAARCPDKASENGEALGLRLEEGPAPAAG